jgi:protein TonB
MNVTKTRFSGVYLGALTSIIVTALLFIALPMLTPLQLAHRMTDRIHGILISARKPPPPPPEERDELKKQELIEKKAPKKVKQTNRTRPKFELPKTGLASGMGDVGGIRIGMSDFNISDSLFMTAFNLNEVDKPPKLLNAFPPPYPYKAKRDNIEGKVVVRFVVDVDGRAKEPKVYKAEPQGLFEKAALRALQLYKFKPAIKNGKAVTCIVKLPISFKLNK